MSLLLTANSRLSQYLKQSAAWQSNATVVHTPQIMTWSQWWQTWQDRALLLGELPLTELPKRVITPFAPLSQACLDASVLPIDSTRELSLLEAFS